MEVEGVSHAEFIILLQLELAEEKFSVAAVWRDIPARHHGATDRVDLFARNQEIRVAARSRTRDGVDAVRQRRAFQQDRTDSCRRQRFQGGDDLTTTQELIGRLRAGFARQRSTKFLRPIR
jgi:hypothetical protein